MKRESSILGGLSVVRGLLVSVMACLALVGKAQVREQWGGKKDAIHYEGTALQIESQEEDGFRLKIQHNYFLDAGGFIALPSFKKIQTAEGAALQAPRDVNFHKLRTTFSGQLSTHWGFKFEWDYGKQRLKYLSMELDWLMNKQNRLRIGNMKVPGPMSVNHSTAANMQIETPVGLALASDRRMGLGYFHTSKAFYFALGGYTYNMNTLLQEKLVETPEWLLAARLAYSPLVTARQRLLLGVHGSYYRPKGRMQTLEIAPGVESAISSMSFLQLRIPRLGYQVNYGGELAYQVGRFLTYGEVLATTIDAPSLSHFATVVGWQGTISYVILGSPRGYNSTMGDFSESPYRPEDKGLEVGFRASGLSLKLSPEDQVRGGGSLISYSAFLTYWMNRHLSLTLQGSYLDHDSQALGAGQYQVPEQVRHFDGADLLSLQARLSIAF